MLTLRIPSRMRRPAHQRVSLGTTLLYAALTFFCMLMPALTASAQTLRWREPEQYDTGDQPSIAVLPTGLVVEFHRNPTPPVGFARTIWYHIGKVSGGTITWGPSHKMDLKTTDVSWPQVVVTSTGNVIFTYSDWLNKQFSDLIYWTGRIQPEGDTSQTIDWVQKEVKFDAGFHNSVALAPFYLYGVFVDVHESGSNGKGLYYRIGYLNDDLSVSWLTGKNGVSYDNGINPHVAVNPDNQVVEVHQVNDESLLHYRRGNLSAGIPGLSAINFRDSQRYDNSAVRPAVAFTTHKNVLQMDSGSSGMKFRTGELLLSNLALIEFSKASVISVNDSSFNTPAVTSNGKVIVAAFVKDAPSRLYFSVANLE